MKLTPTLAGALIAGAAALTFAPAHASNLIVNGDFSGGNTGFNTGYTYVAPSSNALIPEGLYTIGADPRAVHQSWVDVAGSNPMMIVNGATAGTPSVWEEDNLTTPIAGTYTFHASVLDICCNSTFGGPNTPSEIVFQISQNGGSSWTTLASYTSTATDAGLENLLTGSFSSTAGGTFDIRAINGSDAQSGNDFALDNISVAVPEPATWGLMILGLAGLGVALRRRVTLAVA